MTGSCQPLRCVFAVVAPRFVLLAIPVLLTGGMAFAENIDPNNNGSQYAWAENLGWINFEPGGPGGPGVLVSDSALAGWAWSENAGWISLSCTNRSCGGGDYGVLNDAAGMLTGYAWSENAGWINFAPTGAGVVIDRCTGIFNGRAWSENAGWITFSSTGPNPYRVATRWSRVGATRLGVTKSGGGELLAWTAVSGATPFDVVRGRLSTLRSSSGNFQSATQMCISNNLTATSFFTASPVVPLGDGWWFLVRGSTCNGPGTYDDATEVASRDAGITASGNGCSP